MTAARAPRLVMVAGPNGSGKSTLIAALRADPTVQLPALYVNADDLQRERRLPDALEAQRQATLMRAQALAARDDLMYETVMSHPSKLGELQRARAAGYHVTVHLVATDDPAVNVSRVSARVGGGGHDVPADRIRERYRRTLALAPLAIVMADQAVLFDNTPGGDTGRGLRVHAARLTSDLQIVVPDPARWVRDIANHLGQRAADAARIGAHPLAGGRPQRAARLDDDSIAGPLLAVTDTLALQLDDTSGCAVLHERPLLSAGWSALRPGPACTIRYRDGVASVDGAPAPDENS